MKRYRLIGVVLVLGLLVLGAFMLPKAHSNTPLEPPTLKITSGADGDLIPHEVLKNIWNGGIFSRLTYRDVLGKLVLSGDIPVVDYNHPITLDWGSNLPGKMSLSVDFATNPLYKGAHIVEHVPLGGNKFSHPQTPPNAEPPSWGVRFYVLTASWGNNEAEYVFAVRVQGEPGRGEKPALTWDAVRKLSSGEVTPAVIVQTFVGRSITSGVYSFCSELPDDYALFMGWGDIKEPFYVNLVDTRLNTSLDLTKGSIDEFLAKRSK